MIFIFVLLIICCQNTLQFLHEYVSHFTKLKICRTISLQKNRGDLNYCVVKNNVISSKNEAIFITCTLRVNFGICFVIIVKNRKRLGALLKSINGKNFFCPYPSSNGFFTKILKLWHQCIYQFIKFKILQNYSVVKRWWYFFNKRCKLCSIYGYN